MSLLTNVVRRGGWYYFRTRVPVRLRPVVGRSELWKSLRTTLPLDARRRASLLSVKTSELWAALEPTMLIKDAQELVKSWLKADVEAYAAMQSDVRSHLARIATPTPQQTCFDAPKVREPTQSARPATSSTTRSISQAARIAIPELARLEGFRPKRRNDYENAVESFLAWIGEDIDLSAITPTVVAAFKSDLTYYPARGSVRPAYRDLSWKGRVRKARECEEPDVLNAETINTKYLTPLRAIFRQQQEAGLKSALPVNPFDGVTVRKKRGAKKEGRRRDFTAREVRTLFGLPLFTGSRGASQAPLYQPGDVRVSDWRYWVPLISFFTGARLNEVCAIGVDDLRVEGGIPYLLIRDVLEGQSRKSDAAWRRVPLHEELIRLRLPDFFALRKAEGGVRLFDELNVDVFGYVSGPPSKFLARLTKSVEEPDAERPGKLVFYSSRHTVIGLLRSAGVRTDVSKELVGHEDGDVHSGYGGVSLQALKEAVDKIAYDGLELGRVALPLAVLPKPKS